MIAQRAKILLTPSRNWGQSHRPLSSPPRRREPSELICQLITMFNLSIGLEKSSLRGIPLRRYLHSYVCLLDVSIDV